MHDMYSNNNNKIIVLYKGLINIFSVYCALEVNVLSIRREVRVFNEENVNLSLQYLQQYSHAKKV